MFDYEEDGSTRWLSKDDKIQNALEMERFMGVMDSLDAIEDERDSAYQEGYSAGTSDGKEAGYQDGYDVGYEDGAKNEKPTFISILFMVCTMCAITFFVGKNSTKSSLFDKINRLESENFKIKKEFKEWEGVINIFRLITNKAGITPDDMAESLYINFRKSAGCSDETVRAELEEAKRHWSSNN